MDIRGLHVLSGIQRDHWNSTLEGFEDRYEDGLYKELTVLAISIIGNALNKNFIFLTGAPGSGKTHFLVGLFRAKVLADEGVMGTEHALYMPFANMITEIIEGLQETHSTRMGLAKYLPVRYLFIDDISRGERVINPEKIEGQVFREVLLDRFENRKYVVCTSNYTPVELRRMIKAVFGAYVLSRVESSSLFVEFPNKDFRKNNK